MAFELGSHSENAGAICYCVEGKCRSKGLSFGVSEAYGPRHVEEGFVEDAAVADPDGVSFDVAPASPQECSGQGLVLGGFLCGSGGDVEFIGVEPFHDNDGALGLVQVFWVGTRRGGVGDQDQEVRFAGLLHGGREDVAWEAGRVCVSMAFSVSKGLVQG